MTAALMTSWRLAVRLGAQPHRSISAISFKIAFQRVKPGDESLPDLHMEIRTPLGIMFWPLVPEGVRTQGADKRRTLRRLGDA